jgi:hypothetical protein
VTRAPLARFAVAVLLLALGAVAFSDPSDARAETRVVDSSVQNNYPSHLLFSLQAEADSEIVDITLRYAIIGRGSSALGKPDEFQPGPTVDVAISVDTNSGNAYIPVGSEFRYSWEIATADGEVIETPEETFLYMPPNREWKSVENDVMRVYFHGERENTAESYLEAGLETYQQHAVELLKTELPIYPVKVILFATPDEMTPARQGRGGTFDAAVTTCGTKLTSDIVFVIPQSCGTGDLTDTLRHELAHIINEAAGEGPLGQLPSWIDEGAAVVAQTEPGSGFEGAFLGAVRNDNLIPFLQMSTPSNDPGRVNLFYGQSWAMVSFLIEREGPEAFAEFFATIKGGARFDQALESSYGLDISTFEEEFRAAYGLGPREEPEPPAATQPAQQQPNPTPASESTRAPLQTSNRSGGDDGIDRMAIGIIGAAVFFALLAAFAYILSAMLSSNRTSAAATNGPPARELLEDWQRPSEPPPVSPPPPSQTRDESLFQRRDGEDD